jgi:N-acetylneuraminic acid mutarotase
MKNLKLFSIIILLCSACSKKTETPAPVNTTPVTNIVTPLIPSGWKKLENFVGGVRANAVSVAIGSKLYIGLGYNANIGFDGVSNDFYEFDIGTGTWKKLESLPGEGRANAVAFAINGKVYVGMGTNYNRKDFPTIYQDFYEYDPSKNTWTKKADFPFKATDQPVSFVINNKGYCGTGNAPAQSPNTYSQFYQFDPLTDKWKSVAGMPQSRCRGMAFVIDGKAYVGGGEDDNLAKLNDFYEYDADKNVWTAKKALPIKVARAAGFEANGDGYMIGGLSSRGDFSENDIYKYDAKADSWSKEGLMAADNEKQAGRFYPAAVNANGKVYIGMGSYVWNGINLKDFYEATIK